MNQSLMAAALAALFLSTTPAAQAGEAELLARIDKLAAELAALKAELKDNAKTVQAVAQRQQDSNAAPVSAAVPTPTAAPAPVAAVPAAQAAQAAATVLTGYGEVNYSRPRNDAGAAQADVRRAVIGIAHRFDEKTKMVAEFEWEHGVVSANDRGESEVEQLYIERQFDNGLRAKAGLFLIPAGLLNTNHEPTAYYGVERNFVETAIIPSTWREAGIALSGEVGEGWSWDTGLTTGFDLSKWDAAADEGRASPLGSIHQEGQLAKARHLSVHGALNWRGVPGLLLGGSVFTGKAGHDTPGFAAPDARLTMVDLHGRYTPGPWDLSGVYARGQIAHVDALNATFVGQPTPVPDSFAGWYLQSAYRLYAANDYTLSPFLRYERFNTARRYSGLPQGLGVAPGPDENVTTLGLNLRVGEGVVLKADYQKFGEDKSRDRLNLGMGFSY